MYEVVFGNDSKVCMSEIHSIRGLYYMHLEKYRQMVKLMLIGLRMYLSKHHVDMRQILEPNVGEY